MNLTENDANKIGAKDNQIVRIAIDTKSNRALIFDDVVVRIGGNASVVHLDTDEGNAAWTGKGCIGTCIV